MKIRYIIQSEPQEQQDGENPEDGEGVYITLGVNVSNITRTGATITATGTINTDDTLNYTLTLSNGQTFGPNTANTWNISGLTPYTEYNYIVKAETIDGSHSITKDGSFATIETQTIPIYTAEQLLQIGSGEAVTIGGKIYTFSADADYEIQNDITFSVKDYSNQYPNAFLDVSVNQVTNYDTANSTSNPYYTFTAPATGIYKLEAWGAQGGAYNSTYADGGKGAYAVGMIKLEANDTLYVYVGGKGSVGSTIVDGTGGYNGGGTGQQRYAGGGGGATHIATVSGILSSLSNNTEAILMVAGGGGGAGYYSESYNGYGGYAGGYGHGGNGGTRGYANHHIGTGAAPNYKVIGNGSFGQGGNASEGGYSPRNQSAGGGGGGFYGGSSAANPDSNSSDINRLTAGGGGGSSYISTSLSNALLIAGNENMTSPTTGESVTGHSGDGYARITLVKGVGSGTDKTWNDAERQIEKGTLNGEFSYNGYTVAVTDTVGDTSYYPSIPITTVEQLLQIGSGNKVTIGNKTYTFASDANYDLQNFITFDVEEYLEKYPNAFNFDTITLESQITNYETANNAIDSPCYTFKVPATGTYKLEVWGAQGGYYSVGGRKGGLGGYSVGTISLKEDDYIYIYVGQKGGTSASSSSEGTNGYNGGGASTYYGGTGGGASDIRFKAGIWNDSNSLLSRVIVAGGGGGAQGGEFSSTGTRSGGYGGGIAGGTGEGLSSSGASSRGAGGTQTAGGAGGNVKDYEAEDGSFGQGGAAGEVYTETANARGNGGGGRRLVWRRRPDLTWALVEAEAQDLFGRLQQHLMYQVDIR